ncbi:bacterioferritin [Acidocella sp.]|uniref:ferritin-like domain-containing protein n=1 Tax=Acidocella sp. TaxID=50710 RepID=UPI002628C0AC|nr:ferritin-like domain-containing protein [Acidocella sp.]
MSPLAASSPFAQEISGLRARAAALMRGAPDPALTDIRALLQMLLEAELVCARRYASLARAQIEAGHDRLGALFLEQAEDELRHALKLGARIETLGGAPFTGLDDWVAGSMAVEAGRLEIVAANLLGERGVIKLYRAALRYLAGRDRDSRALLMALLADEERHIAGMGELVGGPAHPLH